MGLSSGKCTSKVRLEGKTAIVTGSNTGIGKITVQDFYERGARVIMACRNKEKCEAAANSIKQSCEGKTNLGELVTIELDLASLTSVRNCANSLLKDEARIDLLINNAGVMMCPKSYTDDGYEMQFATNHLGHFLLTLMLLPKIVQSPAARIVNVSSMAHTRGRIDFDDINYNRRSYTSLGAYQQSKVANVLFTKELAKRIQDADVKNVTVYALHPGVIATELGRHLNRVFAFLWRTFFAYFIKTPEQGAQTTIYCAVDEKCAHETGLYYSDCKVKTPSAYARDGDVARRLWEESLVLVGFSKNYDPFKK